MARRFGPLARPGLAALVILFTACLNALADPSPSPSPSPSPAIGMVVQPSGEVIQNPIGPIQWAQASRIFEALSPDQQKKFLNNLAAWKQMSPSERQELRDRYVIQRQKMLQDIQDALKSSGLNLDGDERQVYALRYMQERRKIEQALAQKRAAMIADMQSRLRIEFVPKSSPWPTATPQGTP
jgi:hypothetical protein